MNDSKSKLEESNKRQFGWWAKYYDSFFYWIFFKKVYEKVVEVFEEEFGGLSNARIIDVACGTGEVIYRLAKKYPDFKFCGIDLTREMVLAAKSKNLENRNVSIFEAEADVMPLESGGADVLICTDAFHHFADGGVVAREFGRVLKVGGRVMLVDPPAKQGLKGKIFDFFGRLIDSYNRLYSREELLSIFGAEGFRIIKEEKFYFNNLFIFQKT